jgi:alpha-L-fucosidase
MKSKKIYLLGITFLLMLPNASLRAQKYVGMATIEASDSPADIVRKAANVVPTTRQLKWQRKELTAFIHFGMNTFTNREWGEGTEKEITFNPDSLDADQWVRTLKEAGFGQVILTCKHHDGFCLWPSAQTDHCVRNSTWMHGKGDVVRMVSDACKRHDMDFGVYLSPWDRNSKFYGTEAYNDYFVRQLTELLTQYGHITEVWFDGACGEGPNGKKQQYDFVRWYKLIRSLQPDAIIAIMGPDVRWVGTESGRGRLTEWSVVPNSNMDQASVASSSQKNMIYKPLGDMTGQDLGSRDVIVNAKGLIWYPAETDVSIRPGWFYHATEDSKVKTPDELMDIYFSSVGRNGVLLLNVPPSTKGQFTSYDIQSLLGFKALRDKVFGHNLLAGAKIQCDNGKRPRALLDGKYRTYFSTKGADSTSVITFRLPKPRSFNVVSLQENISVGQRVEHFVLEYEKDGIWKTVAEGTTIGYKRLLKFDSVTASGIRLRILSSRLNPTLSEMGLYLY